MIKVAHLPFDAEVERLLVANAFSADSVAYIFDDELEKISKVLSKADELVKAVASRAAKKKPAPSAGRAARRQKVDELLASAGTPSQASTQRRPQPNQMYQPPPSQTPTQPLTKQPAPREMYQPPTQPPGFNPGDPGIAPGFGKNLAPNTPPGIMGAPAPGALEGLAARSAASPPKATAPASGQTSGANITGDVTGESSGKQLADMVSQGAQYFGLTPQHGAKGLFGGQTAPNMQWMQQLAANDPKALLRGSALAAGGTAGAAGLGGLMMGGGGNTTIVQA
jgi:hypothetical protein